MLARNKIVLTRTNKTKPKEKEKKKKEMTFCEIICFMQMFDPLHFGNFTTKHI